MAAGDPGVLQRNYSAIAVETTLTASISASSQGASGTIIVGSVAGFPTNAPYTLVIDPDTSREEVITVTATSGTTLTILRGQDNTQAVAHSAGVSVRHAVSARDFKEEKTHAAARGYDVDQTILDAVAQTHVHGIETGEGVVVGTTKTQTLTNKTISTTSNTLVGVATTSGTETFTNKTLVSPTITGTGSIAGTFTGNLTGNVTGNASGNAGTATKLATGRDFQIVGDVEAGAQTFDGSGNITLTTSIATGVIVNADINASAAIAATKIAGTAVTQADTGTVTSTMILDGTIVNADINASAGIAYSKLSLNSSITSADIVNGTIVAADIADGTITAAKLTADPFARTNHTGTQAASTISDLATTVKAYTLDEFADPAAAISMNSQKITSLGTPTSNADAATKLYVDTKVADLVNSAPSTLDTLGEIATAIQAGGTVYDSFVLKAGSTMTGALVLNADPSASLGAATKQYVDAVAGSATAAAASAAAAATTYDNFDDRYLGAKSSAPSVDNDGNSLITGALYWNSTSGAMFAWTGSAWGSISSTADIYRYRYTATGGETSKSGVDDNGLTLSYLVGKEQVYLNGVLLVRTTDYVATNGTSIASLAAMAAGDILEIITFTAFDVANVISPTIIDAKGDILAGTSADVVGKLTVGTNGQYLQADSTTATGLKWSTVSGYSAPTLGSTTISSGATVTTISGLTDVVLNGPGSIKDELTLILMGAL